MPVFVLANFVIDLAALVAGRWRPGAVAQDHTHSLLLAAAVGLLWGLASYPFKGALQRLMQKAYLPSATSILKTVLSGIAGIWVHVFIDSFYQADTPLFWPFARLRVLWPFKRSEISMFLILCSFAAVAIYFGLLKYRKSRINP